MNKDLVSIITPSYNSIYCIENTIQSVLNQTYSNWELIIVDDCSTDNSQFLIKKYCELEPRIKYYKTDVPSGSPTLPRNIGIREAQGRFIAFLDSDDMWLPEKLEEQIVQFNGKDIAIVYSNYEKINEAGVRSGRQVIAPALMSYRKILKGNVIGCLTAVYDTFVVGKVYFSESASEDFIMWLSILKKGFIAKNTNTITALYRVKANSLSSNKFKAFSWTWNIYRNIEKLNLLQSCYYFSHYAFRAGLKYMK